MKLTRLLRAGKKYLLDPNYRFLFRASRGKFDTMPDEAYLQKKFRASMGKPLNLEAPGTFNEKLQWLKLHDRKPLYPILADKVAVKDYVAERIGKEYVIPTLGVWDSPEQVEFESLPARFVLKCNHNSGLGMVICKDKRNLDIPKTRKKLSRGLREDYFLSGREWPYRNIPRRILAEQYLENEETAGLTDYKLHCFGGEPRFILVCRDRFAPTGLTEDFFTPQWEHMDIKRPKVPNASAPIPKPAQLARMLALARELSRDIPFVRVDFYLVDESIYFSELTFFPASGFVPFMPESWDETFGSWLQLPTKTDF